MRFGIAVLLLVAAVCFGIGIVTPIIRVEKLYFFTQTPSLVQIIYETAIAGSWLIAAAVAIFSILFPMIKLSVIFLNAFAPGSMGTSPALLKWSGLLSKWSMMDVLLVALVIFAAKSSGLATAMAQPGLWFYAASAICGATAAALLKKQDTAPLSPDKPDSPAVISKT